MISYERIVQWISGPFAVFIGGLAAKWVSSWGFLGALGLPPTGVARAITGAVVFTAASAVTYLGHHKWLTNAAKWWEHSGLTLPSVLESASTPPTNGNGSTSGTGVPPSMTTMADHAVAAQTAADQLRAQLREAGITPEA
jgi:hypothetical protein